VEDELVSVADHMLWQRPSANDLLTSTSPSNHSSIFGRRRFAKRVRVFSAK